MSALAPPPWPETAAAVPRASTRALAALAGGLAAAVLLVVFSGALALAFHLENYRQRALDAASSHAATLALAIAADIARIDTVLRAVVREPPPPAAAASRAGPSPVAIATALALLNPGEPLFVADAAGRVGTTRAGQALPLASLAAQPAFAEARDDPAAGLRVSEPVRAADGSWRLLLLRRLADAEGGFAGVVFVALPVAHFDRALGALALGPGGAAGVRNVANLRLVALRGGDGDGAARASASGSLGEANASDELRAAFAADPRAGAYFAVTRFDDTERANAYRAIDGTPLIALVGLASRDILASWQREALGLSALGLLASIAIGAALLLARRAWQGQEASRAALERELARERAVLQAATDGIHVLDREGRLVEASDAFAAMLGWEREALIGQDHASWDPRHEQPQARERFAAFEVGRRYRYTTRLRRRDGGWVEVELVAVGARIGEADLLVCSARDVGERERATRALRASEALLERTGRLAQVGGWELDLRDGSLRWSVPLARLFEVEAGFRPQPADFARFFRDDARPRIEGAVAAARRDGTPWDLELPVVTAQGRTLWVRTIGEQEREAGEPVRLVGVVQDITERLQRQAELKRERELRAQVERHAAELDELLRERNEMLDVLAHEVRQPLNNASAALQNLAKIMPEPPEPGTASPLLRAQNVMGQVLASIDNTLAAAALLLRTGPIARDDVDVDTLVAVAIGDMPSADRPRIVVRRSTTARTVSADPSLMRLALRNLLANALKHGPPGAPVEITIDESDEPLAMLIDVSDQGPGVDPEVMPRLFERGAKSRRRDAPPGHGLGLYIVRRAMELHGGRVELVSTGAGGTTMRLVLVEAEGA